MGQLDDLKETCVLVSVPPLPPAAQTPHGLGGVPPWAWLLATWAQGGAQVWPARACAS